MLQLVLRDGFKLLLFLIALAAFQIGWHWVASRGDAVRAFYFHLAGEVGNPPGLFFSVAVPTFAAAGAAGWWIRPTWTEGRQHGISVGRLVACSLVTAAFVTTLLAIYPAVIAPYQIPWWPVVGADQLKKLAGWFVLSGTVGVILPLYASEIREQRDRSAATP